jgi:hypothetical protein
MNRLYIGTRKGLFTCEDQNGRWSIVSSEFLGAQVTAVLPTADENIIYAALNHGHFGVKMHRSSDGGESWEEIAAPAYTTSENNSGNSKPPAVDLIWCLESANDPDSSVWAGTIPGGLFKSSDRGDSW